MRRIRLPAFALCIAAASSACWGVSAQLVGSGYNSPVFLAAPQGDPRLFIVERGGIIKIQSADGTVGTFLDSSKTVTSGERGLLGLAFDPGFASNGRFYVQYTSSAPGNDAAIVESYTVSSSNPAVADPGSARLIISIPSNGRSNHKAGWIGFSPADPGNLYIATGDSGSGNDPDGRAQDLNSNLGKMLRITPLPGGGYAVPANNPFVGRAGNDEIWAYGLRNPFRNSFDRLTGDLWIGDVGQSAREEINFEASGFAGGANYGWRSREGRIDNPGVGDPPIAGAIDPVFDYPRGIGGSVIGGYVVRNSLETSLNGLYLFGDFVAGRLFSFNPANPDTSFADRTAEFGSPFSGFQLSSFGEDGRGGVYAMGLNGNLYLLAAAVPEPGSWALMAFGLVGLASVSARGRRRQN